MNAALLRRSMRSCFSMASSRRGVYIWTRMHNNFPFFPEKVSCCAKSRNQPDISWVSGMSESVCQSSRHDGSWRRSSRVNIGECYSRVDVGFQSERLVPTFPTIFNTIKDRDKYIENALGF